MQHVFVSRDTEIKYGFPPFTVCGVRLRDDNSWLAISFVNECLSQKERRACTRREEKEDGLPRAGKKREGKSGGAREGGREGGRKRELEGTEIQKKKMGKKAHTKISRPVFRLPCCVNHGSLINFGEKETLVYGVFRRGGGPRKSTKK